MWRTMSGGEYVECDWRIVAVEQGMDGEERSYLDVHLCSVAGRA